MKRALIVLAVFVSLSGGANAAVTSHIYIPAIHVYAPITGLATEHNLATGAGWWPKVGRPGQDAPVAIAAHDVTPVPGFGDHGPFHFLYKLRKGDLVAIAYRGKTYDYRVTKGPFTEPYTNLRMVNSNPRMLTLSTCWPPHSSSYRMLIYAKLVP